MTNKNKIKITLFLIVSIMLFSSIAYARPLTDVFSTGLLQINNFFENRAYEPYSKAIDFFFFSILFIAIYMMGARYAFKEIKRPEQVIVILLGLMTAFLLVLADISATVLLPYIHWLLYLLLFILYWWLLKGIKNPFWRFVLALLLTLLTIGLIQGLYDYLTLPKVSGISAPGAPSLGFGGFFKDWFGSFKGISLPGVSAPGIPDYMKDWFGVPGVAPTGPTTLPTPIGPTPVTPPPTEGPSPLRWLWLLLPLALLALLAFGAWRVGKRRKPKPTPTPPEKLTTDKIIDLIDEAIRNKRAKLDEIIAAYLSKVKIMKAVDKRTAILNKLKTEDKANLFLDPARTQLKDEEVQLKELYEKEKELIVKLRKLLEVENDLSNELDAWKDFLLSQGVDAAQLIDKLKNIVSAKDVNSLASKDYRIVLRNLPNAGIIWLIVITYDFEKREELLRKDLADLAKEEIVAELVKGKFDTLLNVEKKLFFYFGVEHRLVRNLKEKIELQIIILEDLKNKIRGAAPTPLVPPPSVHPKWPTDEGEFSPIPPEKPVYPIEPVIPRPPEPKPTKYVKYSVDLSEWFMPIKNQGETNACAAFAGTAIMEYLINRKLNKKLDEVDLNKALSELFLWYEIRPDKQSNIVVYRLETAPRFMGENGVCFDSIWPWLPIDNATGLPTKFALPPAQEARDDAFRKHIQNWRRLSVTDPDTWVNELKNGNPILIGMRVEPSLDIVGKAKKNLYIPQPSLFVGAHAVVIVGFTTDFPNPEDLNKTFPAFKIRNSSGSDWGENGYIWIPYRMLPQLLTEEPYVIKWEFEGKREPKGLLPAGITEIEELKVEPIDAEASRSGVEYGTPLTISSKIIDGIAPFKAYCFIYKYEVDERGERVKRVDKDVFTQIYPPKPEALAKAHEKQLGFEFKSEIEQIDSKRRWEDYKRTIELTSKTRQQISSRIAYETGKDIPFLEPGQYKVVFYVRDSSQSKKQSWAFKAVDIIIKESKQLRFEFETKAEILKPEKEPKPIFTIGWNIHNLESHAKGGESNIINNEQQGFRFVWYIEQIGKVPTVIHTGRAANISNNVIPNYFEEGDANLRIILYDKNLDRIAEDTISVYLVRKGGVLARRGPIPFVTHEPTPPIPTIPVEPTPGEVPDIHKDLARDASSLGTEALSERERSELLDDIFSTRKRERKRRNE